MHSFPANKALIPAQVQATVAQHDQTIADLEARLAALTALVEKHDQALVPVATKSVLRRVWHWLTHYEGVL